MAIFNSKLLNYQRVSSIDFGDFPVFDHRLMGLGTNPATKITRGHVLHDAAPTKYRRSEVHDGSALRIRPKARLEARMWTMAYHWTWGWYLKMLRKHEKKPRLDGESSFSAVDRSKWPEHSHIEAVERSCFEVWDTTTATSTQTSLTATVTSSTTDCCSDYQNFLGYQQTLRLNGPVNKNREDREIKKRSACQGQSTPLAQSCRSEFGLWQDTTLTSLTTTSSRSSDAQEYRTKINASKLKVDD